jgi:anti-anti-sigma factor
MLVIDTSQVTFLDSEDVGALVALFVSRRNNDRKLALVSLSARSVAAPQLSGLIELLPVYASAEAATRELVCV